MFNGNAPSPFENPMLKAAGITAPVVHPIQKAAEASQANNVAASDPIAIVNAPSAATIKSFDALKRDSRAPINTPAPVNTVQPHALLTALEQAKAPLAPQTGMFGIPTSTYVNPILAAHEKSQAESAARRAPIIAARKKKEAEEAAIKRAASLTDLETEQSSRSVLAGGYTSSYATPQFALFKDDYHDYQNKLSIEKAQRAVDDERTAFAENYKVTNALPFDMMQVFDDKAEGDARADYLNAFTTTEDFANNYNNFKEDFKNTAIGQGASENDMKRAFATANGIFSDTKTYHMGNDGIYTYTRPKRESGFTKLVKGTLGVAFAYVGGAVLGPAFAGLGNLGATATNAIAQGVANGAVTAAQGGDLSDVVTSGVTAGVGKYATGLSEASEAATAADTIGGLGNVSGFSDTLGSMGTVSAETASLASRAEVANRINSGLQGIQAIDEGNVLGGVAGVAGASGMFSGDTLSKIETGADTIKAVEDKDILGAVSGGLKLADLKAPQEYAEDYLTKEFEENDWVMNNVAPMSKASLGFVDDLTKGDSMEDAITSAFATYAKSGGGLSQLFPDGLDTEIGSFEIPMDFLDPLLELGRQIDKNILQPVKDDVTTVVRKTGQAIRDAAPDVDLPDVDMSGFELPSFDLDIDLPSLNLPSISFADLDLDFSGFDMPSLSMPDIDIDMPSVSLPDFPDFNFPKWESSPDSSDSSEGLDIEAPEVGFDFNASAGREAERTANAERTKAEDFERLDISNYFSNPLLR